MTNSKLTSYFNVRNFTLFNVFVFLFIKIFIPISSNKLALILEPVSIFSSREIITKTNEVRISENLPLLRANINLDSAASEKLKDMIKNRYFAHTSPNGITPWFWMDKSNYIYTYAGENLAIGFQTAQDTVSAWLNSSLHKENILNPKYNEIGVALDKARLDGIDGILVVQMFGKQKDIIKSSVSKALPIKSQKASKSKTDLQSQRISTDPQMATITTPIEFRASLNKFKDVVNKLNISLIFYSAIISAGFLFSIFLRGLKKNLILGLIFNSGLLFLSILMPTLEFTLRSFIF